MLKMFLNGPFILTFSVISSYCDTKVWIYSTEIYDPQNWVGGKKQEECNGLVFPEVNHLSVFINKLNVKQLILPASGTIRFEEDSNIVFDEESQDELNCVELTYQGPKYWNNVTGWSNLDNPDNPAIPYAERPPCRYDDIVIPKGFNSSMLFEFQHTPVKSVTFENEKLSQNALNDIINTDVGQDVFEVLHWEDNPIVAFKITGEECTDLTGCDRRAIQPYHWYNEIEIKPQLQCTDGFVPYSNLGIPICGAQILINDLKPGFTIEQINKKLKQYSSYTHASKYVPENNIQIVFTEKEFTGSSIIDATDFYNILLDDDSYFCEDITLITSGLPLNEKSSQTKSALSIVFGTLFGVIFTFGLLFFVYSPTVSNLNLRNRFLSTRPLSTYILRYDNIEDRANIIDAQSIAGSVISLNRAFENPLYDHPPSTSSKETVISSRLEEKTEDSNKDLDNETAVIVDDAKELEEDLQKDTLNEKEDDLLKDL